MHNSASSRSLGIAAAALFCAALCARAQSPLLLYTDHLVNGFQDWSWGTRNFNNTSPVHAGADSIQLDLNDWEALSLEHAGFNTSPYKSLTFWANGGTSGGQVLQINVEVNGQTQPAYKLSALPGNTWRKFTIPLALLGANDQSNVDRFTFQLTASGSTGAFYVDDIQLDAAPIPALVHIDVDAAQTLRAADARWFALNTAVWDSDFDTPETTSMLKELGTRVLRFPGGSLSDEYHWATDTSLNNTWRWATSFDDFVHVATNVGAQAIITVNYGTGTPAEAAAWVRDANVTNHLGFKYWEIGNEEYGSWETDDNSNPHDPYTYALRARDYIQQMKAADPTIKVGLVSASGENSYSNAYSFNHPAFNPRTGETNYGWTPILLSTLKSLGVTPDFLVEHNYPEYTGQESDPLLLQSTTSWASAAADLRQQIRDYFGAGGTNIELVCTENNSNSGSQGRQSTSLVNGLYLADSLAQLMKTEFNSYVWWDLRNGSDTSGSFDPTLYGWRTNGDLGIVLGRSTKYPAFYAAKLMQHLIQPGGEVLNAASDNLLLSAYSARNANGELNLLVINKDPTATLTAQIVITNFVPWHRALVRSYGIPQDEAARTNGPAAALDVQLLSYTNADGAFTNAFPPYSLTLFTFVPEAARLVPASAPGGPEFIVEGQPGVPYVLQTSTNLFNWSPVATNAFDGDTLSLTNSADTADDHRFWRVVWEP